MRDPGRHWQNKTLLSTLLLPASWLFCLLVMLRRLLYRAGVLRAHAAGCPVIVVGNITVGGTGKTPLVIWLCNALRAAGYHPGIVTRGYGGQRRRQPVYVTTDSTSEQVGDEPLLLQRHAGCPVCVGADRVAGAEALRRDHSCDIIVSDDGLQHYRLGRDIEIAVIDGERGFGNRRCLPAGPLREPVSRLRHVQATVVQGEPGAGEHGMHLEASVLCNLLDDRKVALADFPRDRPIDAIAGIGNPARFFDQLRRYGFNVTGHAFPDHHPYLADDLRFPGDAMVIMTEKDAVKCRRFAQTNYWYLPVTARLDARFTELLIKLLEEKRLGQETA